MALAITGNLLCWTGCVCVAISIWRHNWGRAGLPLAAVGAVLLRLWPFLGLFVGLAVYDLFLHWRRRKRKRAPREVGAKSHARVAGLVGTMRQRVRRRPVLRPSPGGAS